METEQVLYPCIKAPVEESAVMRLVELMVTPATTTKSGQVSKLPDQLVEEMGASALEVEPQEVVPGRRSIVLGGAFRIGPPRQGPSRQ